MIELVIDRKTGKVRQAGTLDPDQKDVLSFIGRAERDLYTLAKGVLGLTRLTPGLHGPLCRWLSDLEVKKSKLLLLPRDHLKTSMFRALAIHIQIQPAIGNIYLEGKEGSSSRILLSSETSTNAQHQLRWIQQQYESNALLRALWPHICWDNPKKEAKRWNEEEMVLPRSSLYPESSIETIGVGGAVTGRHYDVIMKDDLVTFAAANSQVVMREAIEWHKSSRALLDDPEKSLEFIIGTRWGAFDLYQYIMDHDPEVDWLVKGAIEDGKPIFPEVFSLKSLERLRKDLGPLFFLLYMNSAADPSLIDFDTSAVRACYVADGTVFFEEDARDDSIFEQMSSVPVLLKEDTRGLRLNAENHSRLFGWQKYREKVLEEFQSPRP